MLCIHKLIYFRRIHTNENDFKQVFVTRGIYLIYFHPLSSIPGPKLWAISRLPYINSTFKGTYVHDLRKLHSKYGEAVRTAPDEVSFASPQAWHDIFDARPDPETFPKNPRYYKLPNGQPDPGMATTVIFADHRRMRGLMEHGFTQKALRAQEHIIQSYVTLLITRLREKALLKGPGPEAVVNVVDYFNFVIFDLIGDLGFGESFGCLGDSQYHPWITMVFDYIKAFALTAMIRHYPMLEKIFVKLLPQSLLERQKEHFQLAKDKVHRRMNLETQRADFMTPLLAHNKDMQVMSMAEIESTLNMVIIAGSETTATSLSGIVNSLVQNVDVLRRLVGEIRGKFVREEDITIAATKDLAYLNACIWEGLRTSSPTPCGMPRMTPSNGGMVCGYKLPGNVSQVNPFPFSSSYQIYNIFAKPSPPSSHQPSPLHLHLNYTYHHKKQTTDLRLHGLLHPPILPPPLHQSRNLPPRPLASFPPPPCRNNHS